MPALMKGHPWTKYGHKMTYPCAVEVKHDEIRCHVKVQGSSVEFLSYAGKPLANMGVFAPRFAALADLTGIPEFDCGFEVAGNFADSYRFVRSTRGVPDDLADASVKFYLFDLPDSTAAPYHYRRTRMHAVRDVWHRYDVAWDRFGGWVGFEVPECHIARTPEEVQEIFRGYRARGFEGAMVKTLDHLYVRDRSWHWLKLKPKEDADGIITAINMAYATVPNDEFGVAVGDPLGRAGSVRVQMVDGSIAEPHGIPHDLGRDMIENPHLYIGQWCEFCYMELDRRGGYRHPTFKRLREAKS